MLEISKTGRIYSSTLSLQELLSELINDILNEDPPATAVLVRVAIKEIKIEARIALMGFMLMICIWLNSKYLNGKKRSLGKVQKWHNHLRT